MDGVLRKRSRSFDSMPSPERHASTERRRTPTHAIGAVREQPRSYEPIDDDYDDGGEVQQIGGCITFAACCGVLAVALGCLLIFWADLDRVKRHALRNTRAIISTWTDNYQHTWEETRWTLLLDDEPIATLLPSNFSINMTDTPKKIEVQSSEQSIRGLISLALPPADKVLTPVSGVPGRKITSDMMREVRVSVRADTPGMSQQVLELYHGPLVMESTTASANWKTCHYHDHGFWTATADHLCHIWQILYGLCYKVEIVDGQWQVNHEFGNVGCEWARQYNPLVMHRVRVANWRSSEPPNLRRDEEQGSHLSIFHAHDPFLRVSHMTQGTMMLAQDSVNEVAWGVVAVVLGAVCATPFFLLKVLQLTCPQTRRWRATDRIPLKFELPHV